MEHTIQTICRICGSAALQVFLKLGTTPLADLFVEADALQKPEPAFPLDVAVCEACSHVQLLATVQRNMLYGDEYAFFTSGSPHAVDHFREYAAEVFREFPAQAGHLVLEIASNDGTLLKFFKSLGARVVGVDPAAPAVEKARAYGIDTVHDFFNSQSAEQVQNEYGKAGLVLANNVVAHVDDLHDFMEGVRSVLAPNGVFVAEVQYFPFLFEKTQFDNVYHEHHSFFSLRPLKTLYEQHGIRIIRVKTVDTQGGSLRVFAVHKDNAMPADPGVQALCEEEIARGFASMETYASFGKRVEGLKKELLRLLTDLKRKGKRIVGYGAPAKGNTLLNYCGIGIQYLDYIVDRTPFKFGKYTPGMHIPVYSEEKIAQDGYPDYYLLLVWNYSAAVLQKEKAFIASGGRFVVPIPYPRILP